MKDVKLVHLGILVPESQKKLIEKWAHAEDRSISAVLRKILEREIERRKEQSKEVVSGFEDL